MFGSRWSSRSCSSPHGLSACLGGRPMPEPLDEPLGVVAGDELRNDSLGLVQGAELVYVDALLFENAHEALGDPVTLGLADVRGRDRAPQPLHLVDPVVADVLRAPVAANGQAPRDVLPESPKGMADPLTNRFQRGPAIAQLARVPPDDLGEMMIDRAEE